MVANLISILISFLAKDYTDKVSLLLNREGEFRILARRDVREAELSVSTPIQLLEDFYSANDCMIGKDTQKGSLSPSESPCLHREQQMYV